MFFIVNYIKSINTMVFYSVFVIGVVYIVPFIFFSIIKVCDKYEIIKQYINQKSLISKIKIRSFIFQNNQQPIHPEEINENNNELTNQYVNQPVNQPVNHIQYVEEL